MARERFDDFHSRSRLHVVRDERLAAEVFDPQRRSRRKRMFRTHDQRELIFQNRERFDLAILRFRSHQREIDVALENFTGQVARHVTKELPLHIAVLLAKREYQRGQQVKRSAFIRPDAHTAALHRLQLGNRLSHLIAQTQNALRVVVDHLSGFGEHRRLLRALEPRQSDACPLSSSSRRIAMLAAGCVRNTLSAAFEKLFSWTTLEKYSSCAISMRSIITTLIILLKE